MTSAVMQSTAGFAASHTSPIQIGIDDGYAMTKLALADGRLLAIPSQARIGHARITWLDGSAGQVAEYETGDARYAVGDVDGEPTRFDGYPFSGLNRAIVQHALQRAGLAGRQIHAVSGLPVSSYYRPDGSRRSSLLARKRHSLRQPVRPLADALPAIIDFHEVLPEALAAWYDHVIHEDTEGVSLGAEGLQIPIAVIDIGGRTTDFVVVADQAVHHTHSGSLQCGLLDLEAAIATGICSRFELEHLSQTAARAALTYGTVRLFGETRDVSSIVQEARRELVIRLRAQAQRQLGQGAELERILLVGGGAEVLAADLADWFPNQQVPAQPAFANARGMLKYLRYVCEESAVH